MSRFEKRLTAPAIPEDLSGVNNSEKRRLLKKQKAYVEQCKRDFEEIKAISNAHLCYPTYEVITLAGAEWRKKRLEDALSVPTRRR